MKHRLLPTDRILSLLSETEELEFWSEELFKIIETISPQSLVNISARPPLIQHHIERERRGLNYNAAQKKRERMRRLRAKRRGEAIVEDDIIKELKNA